MWRTARRNVHRCGPPNVCDPPPPLPWYLSLSLSKSLSESVWLRVSEVCLPASKDCVPHAQPAFKAKPAPPLPHISPVPQLRPQKNADVWKKAGTLTTVRRGIIEAH